MLLCSFNTSLMPTTGSMPGIKAFTAAVFGGIGSIPGALLGVALLPLIPARALQVGLGIMLMAHMVWHLLINLAVAAHFTGIVFFLY